MGSCSSPVWQAVVRGLVKDENDNAGAVMVVERVKAFTRTPEVPWLIDAHAGKAEDQTDDADPSKAMRGASGAAGAADYTLACATPTAHSARSDGSAARAGSSTSRR